MKEIDQNDCFYASQVTSQSNYLNKLRKKILLFPLLLLLLLFLAKFSTTFGFFMISKTVPENMTSAFMIGLAFNGTTLQDFSLVILFLLVLWPKVLLRIKAKIRRITRKFLIMHMLMFKP